MALIQDHGRVHVSLDSFVYVQMFGFLLYVSEYGAAEDGGILYIAKVKSSGH